MQDDPLINVARTLPRSAVNGPGERFVVWVQGCSLRCPGCWNPDTWSVKPRRPVRASALAQEILGASGIEGVTLTGGEPFEQASALVHLVTPLRQAGLSVMAFTGFRLDELGDERRRALLSLCDVVVAGRYVRALRAELGWRGSSNQRVHFLTDRYTPAAVPDAPECEVYIEPDGSLTMTGFPITWHTR
ncbi:MAG: ribonucleoside-triphosphate reductase activating protein [Myxococcales bacterium]|nr:ribonucleoside-triphosphate reductase activating protein [Myxococcales bacterium]